MISQNIQQEVKDILRGKDLYDMPEPTPKREAQRYYDLVEGEYDQYDYLLEKNFLVNVSATQSALGPVPSAPRTAWENTPVPQRKLK